MYEKSKEFFNSFNGIFDINSSTREKAITEYPHTKSFTEFIIKEIGDNLIIFATDKAYELLGLTQKQIVLTRQEQDFINNNPVVNAVYKSDWIPI